LNEFSGGCWQPKGGIKRNKSAPGKGGERNKSVLGRGGKGVQGYLEGQEGMREEEGGVERASRRAVDARG
jgi:hypothetical protein